MRTGTAAAPVRALLRAAPAPLAALALLLSACSTRIIDIRPYAAHPDQKLENEDVLLSIQNDIRTEVRAMRKNELDEAFRITGKPGQTANPFFYHPPEAPVKFTVFHLNLRNESDNDTFIEYGKILLRDDLGGEHRPLTLQKLMDYWLGKVTIELGKPLTWTPQMEALKRKEDKEKLLVRTLYEGGRLPSRGEHSGYLAFRDIPPQVRNLQLLIEVVTRASRYGSPLAVSLSEFNFKVVKIRPPKPEDEEMKVWRNQ